MRLWVRQGQCGFGTSLEVLAKQRRQEWNLSVQMAKFAQGIAQEYVETLQVKDSSLPSPAQHAAAASHLFSGSGGETKQPSLGRQAMAPKLLDHSAQARELEQTRECALKYCERTPALPLESTSSCNH